MQLEIWLRKAWSMEAFWYFVANILAFLVGVAIAFLGPAVIMAPWDVFILLDGAWRILNGLVPNRDFYNPIGPLTYWFVALGMRISGESLSGIIYGNLLLLAMLAPWASLIFVRKLPGILAIIMIIFLAVLIVSARPLGYDPSITTYAMIYNRHGWAISLMLVTQLLFENRKQLTSPKVDAVSGGLLLGLVFLTKVSFFLVDLLIVVVACGMQADLRRSWLLIVGGFIAVCSAAAIVGGFDFLAYIRDLGFVASVQSRAHRIGWLMSTLRDNVFAVLLLALIWVVLVAAPCLRRILSMAYAIRVSIVFGVVVVSGIAITAGNASERRDIPFFLIAGLLLLVGTRLQTRKATISRASADYLPYCASAVLIIVILFGEIVWKDVRALEQSYARAAERTSAGETGQYFDSQRLHDFYIPKHSNWNTAYSRAGEVPARINDGLALVKGHVMPHNALVVLALADPFSFALNIRPAAGPPLWWDLGFSFARNRAPPASSVFKNADWVVYPVLKNGDGCCMDTVFALLELYDKFLEENYVLAGQSLYWRILRRKGGPVDPWGRP